MFVAVVGGVLVGGALAHGNYSDYGDYSQYSDFILLIQAKEAELSKRKQEAEIANRQFIERGNELKEILQENGLSVNSLDERDVEAELTKLEKELEAAIAEDVRELEYIDKAIRKLNDIKNQKTNP
ncbi:MAG: hypothetical protein PUJ02_06495 [Anaerovibrio sp.]|uniref:hypothetical protein n=1 Tax=Anaerovibrio sp. TaxID=1872532 RepID=UPI002601F391|nr:hypothetical protein [Anaerovibrio sp.]MDD7678117.1 hypothetical protein [Anaerovibrio sp.]